MLTPEQLAKYRQEFLSRKAPKTDKNYVGIEIEFIMPKSYGVNPYGPLEKRTLIEEDRKTLTTNFIEANVQNYVTFDYEHIQFEHPCYAWEVRLLCRETSYKDPIRRLIKALVKSGATVNKSCGNHVHLDMRARDPKLCYKALVEKQDKLFSMCAEHRKTNKYCAPIKLDSFGDFTDPNYYREGKYGSINPMSYRKYKTIEVRCHESILDAEAEINWVKTLVETVSNVS